MIKEILTIEDVKKLVDLFYDKVRQDDVLSKIFDEKIANNWSVHLNKMYRFWQTILLEEHTYSGSPFLAHAKLPIQAVHFDRWLLLFYKTIDENFTGQIATEAKWRAERMSEMFQHKLNFQKTTGKSLH